MSRQPESTATPAGSLYTAAGFYMLRAPALPAKIFTQISASGALSPEILLAEDCDVFVHKAQETCAQQLLELAAQPQIALAFAVASPSLREGLERFQAGHRSPAQQKRLIAGLLRYLIRMSTRPTPFGLFSGVASGTLGDTTQAYLPTPAIASLRARTDMAWLFAVLRMIEADPLLVRQLKVRLNQTAYLVGDRAVLPFVNMYGEQEYRVISLRATSVVRKIFELTQQFMLYTDLHRELQTAFPAATDEQIERVLQQLWDNHFFISELHPPLTEARPDRYVLKHLEMLSGAEEYTAKLTSILEGISALNHTGITAPVHLLTELVQKQEKLALTKGSDKLPLQIDAALALQSPTLHHAIGQAAVQIAEFLLRQTSLPSGLPHLQEYRKHFREKYGDRAEVPLLDLLSAENGLDAPAGYEKPPRTYHRPSASQAPDAELRNRVLVALVAEAINQQSVEVELTEELQQHLQRWSPKREQAPLSLEIYLNIHARSREAIDAGEWTAVVCKNCGSTHAGRTFGRFFDMIGESGIQHIHALTSQEESLLPEYIFAELSYQPSPARLANVAIRPLLHAYEIAVGTTPSVAAEHVIELSDLVVGVRNNRFYLRSLRLNKQVRVSQTHMLNIQLAPNPCRFITEIANDGQPVLSPFDWGAVSSAPFLPRLILKTEAGARCVISPARWHLQARMIIPSGHGSELACWLRGLQQWRAQWRVPRYVYLSEMDNRLLLDLENVVMVAELRDELLKHDGQRTLLLEELLPDMEHLWLQDEQRAGYFSEIVVPLVRNRDAAEGKPADFLEISSRRSGPVLNETRKCFPGEEWVYVKWYAAFNQHDELLATAVRDIVQALQERDLIDSWFFIRYSDPQPHLRLRFHARRPDKSASVIELMLSKSAQHARRGQIQNYTLDTYEREVERYGGPAAIALLEQVFTLDSVVISDLLTLQHMHRLSLDPSLLAVFTLDQFFSAWGCDFQQRLAWTHSASEKYTFSKEYRPERRRYCDLLSPRGQLAPDLAEQRGLVLELMHPRLAYLTALGTQVRQLADAGMLWVTETALLDSLAHMHLNRLIGVDHLKEVQIYAFWRHTLDSLDRRPA